VNQCPPPNPCNGSNIVHTGDLTVTLPHGVCAANPSDSRCAPYSTHHQAVAPNVNMNVQSWDFSLKCDPFFGDPTSSECKPAATGQVICSVSHANLGAALQPPGYINLSMNVQAGDQTILANDAVSIPGVGFKTTTKCNAPYNGCAGTTRAICAPPFIPSSVTETAIWPIQVAPTAQTALTYAAQNCYDHDGDAPTWLAWKFFSTYQVKLGAVSCVAKQLPLLDVKIYTENCY
jgi:hypothetical protein